MSKFETVSVEGDIPGIVKVTTRFRDSLNEHQPEPVKNDHPAVWSLVMADMIDRDIVGAKRYGTRLQPHNGRDALVDAYQEALDLACYMRQAIFERDGK